MSIKGKAGTRSGPYKKTVNAAEVDAFRKAVGSSNQKDVPTTFITRWREGEFEILNRLGISLSSVLHGEQEYQFTQPIEQGKTYEFETILTRVMEKKSSRALMQFLYFESEIVEPGTQSGVARSITLIIVRKKLVHD